MCSMAKHWNQFLLGLLAVSGALMLPATATALDLNRPAPNFTLPSTSGNKVTLSQFRGKKMVLLEFYAVNYGAT